MSAIVAALMLLMMCLACESRETGDGESEGGESSLGGDTASVPLRDIVDLRVGGRMACVLTSQRRLFCGMAFSSELIPVAARVEHFDVGERSACFQTDDGVVRCGVVEVVDSAFTWRAIGHTRALPSARWLSFEGPSMKLCVGPVGPDGDEIGCYEIDARSSGAEPATLESVRLPVGLTEVDDVWDEERGTCAVNRSGVAHCVENADRRWPSWSRHVTFDSPPSSSARTFDTACRLRSGQVLCEYKSMGNDSFALPEGFDDHALTALVASDREICVSNAADVHACLDSFGRFVHVPRYDGLRQLRFGAAGEYCGEDSSGESRCWVERPMPQGYKCTSDGAQGLLCAHAGWFGRCTRDPQSVESMVCRVWPPTATSEAHREDRRDQVSVVSHHACRLAEGELSCTRWDPMSQAQARELCQTIAGAPCDATPYAPLRPAELDGAQLTELFDDDRDTLCVSGDNHRHACMGLWAFAARDDELVHSTARDVWSPSLRHVPELDGYTRVRIADGGERWCGLLPDGTAECNGRPLTIESPQLNE